jgi:hypothetical protein
VKVDATAAVLAHSERVVSVDIPTGNETLLGHKIVADQIEVWTPTREQNVQFAEVEAWLLKMHERYRLGKVVFDPSQAFDLEQRLRRRACGWSSSASRPARSESWR